MADPFLQDAVRWQSYCVFDPLCFEELVDIGIGEPRVGPEINTRDLPLVAFDNRLQHTVPSVGAVDVAGTKRTSFQHRRANCLQSRQAEHVIEFAIGQQSGIGGHHRAAKLEHDAAVKSEPESPTIRFTRRVRHDRSLNARISY
jgi:hypothetical protein